MTLAFIETRIWTRLLPELFPSDEAYAELQRSLLYEPEQGSVMPGCGGLRKMRWPDPRRGKGKRGGLRIIYLHVPEASVILLMALYDKDAMSDLSAAEKKILSAQAATFRLEIQQAQHRNKK